jgi:formiminoglutamase
VNRLPLLLSVPHAGLDVPSEVAAYCVLTPADIAADGDLGAAEIYALEERVTAFMTTGVARAIVDLNRAEDDRRPDGVVKTVTTWEVPVYAPFPPEEVVETLLARYHRPYHARLRTEAGKPEVLLGVDCHTMAAAGPPIGPDPGITRPAVCLSDGDGTCPRAWIEELAACFRHELGDRPELEVTINRPFTGGHIIRAHARELPWIQLELSRGPFLTTAEKRTTVISALERFCEHVSGPAGP